MTADSPSVLYVHNREVWRGPVRSQPRRMQYDLFDPPRFLKVGENIIAVHVSYDGIPRSC